MASFRFGSVGLVAFTALVLAGSLSIVHERPHRTPIAKSPSEASGASPSFLRHAGEASIGSFASGEHGSSSRADSCQADLFRDPRDAPAWAIRFGQEFWRQRRHDESGRTGVQSGFVRLSATQAGNAIDRVSHAFCVDGESSAVCVQDARYRATLETEGISFAPLRPGSTSPAADGADTARFYTRAIRGGEKNDYVSCSRPSSWCVTGNTAQRLLDPASGLLEYYEASRAGVEVTWILPRRLESRGDLAIESELTGVQFTQETSSGLHFADANGTARVKVGPAVATDQKGRTWQVPLKLAGQVLRATLSSEVLEQADFPLALDPLISPEFGIDQPIDSASPCTRAAPAVAANGAGYLVAWTHGKGDATDRSVMMARVDAAGTLLDPYGVLLSASAGEQTTCAAAGTRDGFLVVWSGPHGNSLTDWDIFGARVQPDGTVLDSMPLTICGLAGVQNSPAVAANGENFLVVWRDSRSTGVYGTIVTPQGQALSTNGVAICTAANDQFSPSVASLGTNFLVTWQDYRKATSTQYYSDIYGARVAGDGTIVDTNGIAICTRTNSQFHPAVAADGTNYLVVWEEYDLGGNDICGARVSPDGLLLDTNAIVVSHAPNAQVNPVVAPNDGGFLVIWQDYRQNRTSNFAPTVYGARVRDDGSVLDTDGVPLCTAPSGQCCPALASCGNEFLVVWQDFRNNPGTTLADIYGARVNASTNLVAHTDFAVSGAANAELAPALAASGTDFLAVWADTRNATNTGRDIYGARLDQNGGLLDLSPIPICTAVNNQSDPAVAAQDTGYLVVWSDWRNTPSNASHADIYGSLVTRGGVVQQPDGFAVCTATNDQSLPAVALQGTNFLVVWQDARNSLATTVRLDIYGTRVSGTGEVLDPAGIAICTNLANQTAPAVAANGTEALVVWTDYRTSSANGDIYGARVGSDGTVADTNSLAICTAPLPQFAPAVAGDGQRYFVVWTDSRNATANPDIYGTMVNADGTATPTNGFAIRLAPGQQSMPTVAYNGAEFLVAWQEAGSSLSNSFDVLGTRVSVEDSSWANPLLLIDTNANNQLAPVAAAGGDGRFLVFNQGFQYSAARTVANLVNLEAIPRLDSGAMLPGGPFKFRLLGAAGEQYDIEASEDMKTWTTLQTVLNTNGSIAFTDEMITNLPARFYRAVLRP